MSDSFLQDEKLLFLSDPYTTHVTKIRVQRDAHNSKKPWVVIVFLAN